MTAPSTARMPKDRSGGDAIRMSAAVLDKSRLRERPCGDEDCRAGREEPEQRRLDSVLREPEREHDNRDACKKARARLRQQEHECRRVQEQGTCRSAETVADRGDEPEAEPERGVGEECERVPVSDRPLQTRNPAGVVRDRVPAPPCRADAHDEDSAERDRKQQRQASAWAGRGVRPLRGRRRRTRAERCPLRAHPRNGHRRSTTTPSDPSTLRVRPPRRRQRVPTRSRSGNDTSPRDQPTRRSAATSAAADPSDAVAPVPGGSAEEECPPDDDRDRQR